MNSLVLLFFGLVVFCLGYIFYANKIAALFEIGPNRKTPAYSKYDGVDYVPAKNWLVLFGHHFSSIAGAGPIIGPVIGCIYWGWLPSLLWVVLGTVLIGGVHDFVALMISVREGGNSVADIAAVSISKKAKFIFSVFVWLALILVIAVFVHLCAKTFVTEPKIIAPSLGLIPVAVLFGYLVYIKKVNLIFATALGLILFGVLFFLGQAFPVMIGKNALMIWTLILLVYCFVASVTPVNILLQPRDYLCSFLLIFGTMAGLIGLLISRPPVSQPAFIGYKTEQGVLWPMMCVTIACGAISGFHSLIASGTTSKQLASERHAKRIGYGAMVIEGIVALLAILAVVSGISQSGVEICNLLTESGPICVFGQGYAGLTRSILGPYGMFIAIMILNAFILTTLDTATRVCRYITEELMGIGNRFFATFLVVVLAAFLALTGAWNKIWPVFGASNQLVAALALFVASCWLLAHKKTIRFTILPAIFMFITTFIALCLQSVAYLKEGNYLLLLVAFALIVLSLVMLDETRKAMKLSLAKTS
ncbi:MAG: carbon starvation protein A [Candidatus Omnitrophica bacterium]|nr:carbon starvation protein A [Candidatus Omnitrophota bacterium]